LKKRNAVLQNVSRTISKRRQKRWFIERFQCQNDINGNIGLHARFRFGGFPPLLAQPDASARGRSFDLGGSIGIAAAG
jgi:hypothetical protein